MEYSRIKINDATEAELQTLKGIGPMRAEYIKKFRQEVGRIRNIFDLATAANISIKAANRISDHIIWHTNLERSPISFSPLIITSISCFWLFGLAYKKILNIPRDPAEFFFSASIGMILSGALIATADITLASARKYVSETTRLFSAGLILGANGLLIMTTLSLWGLFKELTHELSITLNQSMLFVSMVLIIFWMMYGPAMVLRYTLGRSNLLLRRCKQAYEWSHLPMSFAAASFLAIDQPVGSLEEIFAIWATVILTVNGIAMTKGRSAFSDNLSPRDLERYEFLLRTQIIKEPRDYSRLTGVLCFASAAILAVLLLEKIIQL